MNTNELFLNGLERIDERIWDGLYITPDRLEKSRAYQMNYYGILYIVFWCTSENKWWAVLPQLVKQFPNRFPDVFKSMIECDIP